MSPRGKGPCRDPKALQFVLVWTRVIAAVLRDVGVRSADIEDLTQELIVRAWIAAKNGKLDVSSPPAVRAWVKVVAKRLGGRSAVRSKRATPRDDVDVAGDTNEADGRNIARDLLNDMRAATTPERWHVWLAFTQGATLEDIAEEERLPVGTVATRVRLARRDFQAALSRERAREAGPVVPRRRRR